MTDRQRFEELYKSVGVDFKTFGSHSTGGVQIRLEANVTKNIEGYNGFETNINFDEYGNFINQNIYE